MDRTETVIRCTHRTARIELNCAYHRRRREDMGTVLYFAHMYEVLRRYVRT